MLLAAAVAMGADTAREHYLRGVELLKSGQDKQAYSELKRAAELRPDLLQVRVLLGLALFRSGDAIGGEREARAVLVKDDANASALHLLGLCLLRQEQLTEGVDALESSLRMQPGNLDAAATLGTVYAGRGDLAKAEALLDGALGKSGRPEALLIRGLTEKARNDWTAAARSLEAVTRANPKLPVAHAELGHTYLLLGDSDRAERAFLDELRLQPDDFHASVYLAWHYLKERRYKEAVALLSAAAAPKPDHAGVNYMLGQAKYALGEYAGAAELLERAVQTQPDLAAAHVLLARVYAKLGRLNDARKQQQVIARLREAEQRRNLGSAQSYGSTSNVPQLGAR
jgi:tetratricopeptide (TPR) repeat protein